MPSIIKALRPNHMISLVMILTLAGIAVCALFTDLFKAMLGSTRSYVLGAVVLTYGTIRAIRLFRQIKQEQNHTS